jgi:hypothetical protein
MRTVTAAEQLDDITKAPVLERLLVIGVDRILDPRQFLAIGPAGEDADPVDREVAVGGRASR